MTKLIYKPTEFHKSKCPRFTKCQPLVICAAYYPQIRKDSQSACSLNGFSKDKGACCPKPPKITGMFILFFSYSKVKSMGHSLHSKKDFSQTARYN